MKKIMSFCIDASWFICNILQMCKNCACIGIRICESYLTSIGSYRDKLFCHAASSMFKQFMLHVVESSQEYCFTSLGNIILNSLYELEMILFVWLIFLEMYQRYSIYLICRFSGTLIHLTDNKSCQLIFQCKDNKTYWFTQTHLLLI
jgi:hypothetical protein